MQTNNYINNGELILLSPLINSYRYNAYRDVIVNADNDIFRTDSIALGAYTFVKETYYSKWSKKPKRGYLIKLDSCFCYLQAKEDNVGV